MIAENRPDSFAPPGRGRRLRTLVILAAVVAVIVVAWSLGLGHAVPRIQAYLRHLGPWAPAAFVLFYAVYTVAALPATPLTVAAGALFGSAIGVAVVSVGATFGASASFLIARYAARDTVSAWLGRSDRLRHIYRLTARNGPVLVAIVRLVPLFPFVFVNYAFGLTRVPFWTYVFWTWLCTLPATVVYVIAGDATARSVQGRFSWPLVVALVLAIAILVAAVQAARQRLRDSRSRLAEEDDPQ